MVTTLNIEDAFKLYYVDDEGDTMLVLMRTRRCEISSTRRSSRASTTTPARAAGRDVGDRRRFLADGPGRG